MVTAALYFVSGVDASQGKIHTMIVLGKIAVSMVQILTQVGTALQLEWPATFRWFVDLLKVFSFDFLGFINIGCLTGYTYFEKVRQTHDTAVICDHARMLQF